MLNDGTDRLTFGIGDLFNLLCPFGWKRNGLLAVEPVDIGLKDGMNFSCSSPDDRKAISVQAFNRGNFANIGGATSMRLADTLDPQAFDPTSEFRSGPSNPSSAQLISYFSIS